MRLFCASPRCVLKLGTRACDSTFKNCDLTTFRGLLRATSNCLSIALVCSIFSVGALLCTWCKKWCLPIPRSQAVASLLWWIAGGAANRLCLQIRP